VFVFSRRAIQRCIDELRGVLSDDQLEELVKPLNLVGRDRFAKSWEICLLHSLSRVGTILHEVPLPGGRKPDIRFTYPGENAVGFIADVTAISDEGLHSANPVRPFSQELARLAYRVGLDPDHLHYDVRGRQTGPYGFQKTTLRLPPQRELAGFLDARIGPFLKSIRDDRMSQHQITIDEDEIAFTISYDVSQRFMTGGYLAYDVALSRKKNPL
jgi:hypothetical protein